MVALRSGNLELVGFACQLPNEAPFRPACNDPLFVYEFHQLGWFAGALAQLDEEDPLRRRLVEWGDRYLVFKHDRNTPYWDAYPLASRLLALLPLAITGQIGGEAVRRALESWAVAILALQETHLQGNHLLRSRAAAAAGSLFLSGAGTSRLRRAAWRALRTEAERQFLTDGFHEERTPAYHLLCLSDLLTCLGLAASASTDGIEESIEGLRRIAIRALVVCAAVTHADQRVAAFGDSAPETALAVDALHRFAAVLGSSTVSGTLSARSSGPWDLVLAPGAGFAKLGSERLELFVSHGPFGAPAQPGHAHCDLFAFEVDLLGKRVIVDPGVHAYHEPEWRLRSRASSEHATASVEGREQAELWSRFRCGWRPSVETARWTARDGGWSAELVGKAFGPDPLTFRRWIECGGSEVSVRDSLEKAFSVALPLAPATELETIAPNLVAARPVSALTTLRIEVVRGTLAVETCAISHAFGARVPSQRLRLRSTESGQLEWRLRA